MRQCAIKDQDQDQCQNQLSMWSEDMSNEMEKILSRKLLQLFPDQSLRAEVIEWLNTYGIESHEQEASRLRLALLKLSGEAPTLDDLKSNTKYAKEDFRDILTWAEYPRQSKQWSIPDGPKKKEFKKISAHVLQVWNRYYSLENVLKYWNLVIEVNLEIFALLPQKAYKTAFERHEDFNKTQDYQTNC